MKEQMEGEQLQSIFNVRYHRYLSGLEHVTHGLDCLRYFPIDDCNEKQKKGMKKYEKEKRKYDMHPNHIRRKFRDL